MKNPTLKEMLLNALEAKELALAVLGKAKQAKELVLKASACEKIEESVEDNLIEDESIEDFEEDEEESEEEIEVKEKMEDFDYVKTEGWSYERTKKSKYDEEDFEHSSEEVQISNEECSYLELSEGIDIPSEFKVSEWEDKVLEWNIDREDCVLDKRESADFELNGFEGLFDDELAIRLEKAASAQGKKYFMEWKRLKCRYDFFVEKADSIFKRQSELSSLGERKLKVACELIFGYCAKETFLLTRLGKRNSPESFKECWDLFAEVVEELDGIRI